MSSKDKETKEEAKKENLTFWIPKIRTTQTALDSYKSKAADAGLSLSELVRQSLDSSIIIQRTNIVEPQAVYQLSSIGNNLNQLVRKEHIHDKADTQKMREILSALDTIIMGLVGDS